jgi:Tol biopolymer transport system component
MINLCAEQTFDSNLEALTLTNITQVTNPSMGFEKAGEAYFSPDGTKIIFQAVPFNQKHYQIYLLDLEERIPRMISTGKGACTCAYFRPDGKKVIFASSHSDPELNQQPIPGYKREGGQYTWEFTPYMNIYEANLDGSELTALTSGPAYHAECAYSSDGKRIVFASNTSGSMNIYIMDAKGEDVRQVTHTDHCYNGGCFFSPDNKQIVFRADRNKRHYLQIYTIDADGTNEQQITNNEAVNWAPYWYPFGKIIAFTTSLHGHSHYEIYGMNIETGVQQRLTHNATFDGLPVFNREGSKLLWTSKRGPDNTSQIFIADFNLPNELK